MEDCIIFSGYISHSNGYGYVWVKGKNKRAHRWVMEKHLKVEIPSHVYVLHKCNNKKCVNPNHLYLGNAKMNALDCVAAGNHYKDQRFGRKVSSNSKTGVKGVIYENGRGKWKASIRVGAKRIQKRFVELEDAINWRHQQETALW